jgi:hypothetical protein
MLNIVDKLFKTLLQHEESWCKYMGYKNPYLDHFKNHITSTVVTRDAQAYIKYKHHRIVYDKLWIAKTQHMKCGLLDELSNKHKRETINYPIFIKPRWGHLSATSKNCYKINNQQELEKYLNIREMMWSEFIDGTEGMTDFLLLNGNIVYQLSYDYSHKQNGFSDVWKYISPDTPTPTTVIQWVNHHMDNYTGFVNVQYRKDIRENKHRIIEVGLRPARSGAYIIATDNEAIMRNIHNVVDKNYWDSSLEKNMRFTPYYSFKCFTKLPILYLWPQKILDCIVSFYTPRPLYEYYFEPVNNEGTVFLQFSHDNFDTGMEAKKKIELLFNITQFIMVVLILFSILSILLFKSPLKYLITVTILGLFFTRFLNPLSANYALYKVFKSKHTQISPREFNILHNL